MEEKMITNKKMSAEELEQFEQNIIKDEVILPRPANWRAPMAMPEDIGKQRRRWIFGSEYRLRIPIQTVTIENKNATLIRRIKRTGKQCFIKLGGYASALLGVDTAYSGFVYDGLIAANLLQIGDFKLYGENGSSEVISGATRNLIMVALDGLANDKNPVRKIAKYIVMNGLWIIEDASIKGGIAVCFRNKHGIFQFLIGYAEHLDMDQLMKDGKARRYMYFIDSPSGYRTGTLPMIEVPAYLEEEYWCEGITVVDKVFAYDNLINAYMEKVIDIATAGMYSIERDANAGILLRIDKGIKKVGREALGITPSTYLGDFENIAIFCGEHQSPKKVEYFEELDIDSNIEDWTYQYDDTFTSGDGEGLVAVEAIQKMVFSTYLQKISRLEAYKFGGQHRINSFVKGHNRIIKRHAILAAINDMRDSGEIKGIIQLPRTREASIEFAKKMGKEWAGYLVVIGDLMQVEYFGDLTCVKCATDFSRPLELRIMDISHSSHGFVPLSKQMIVQMQLEEEKFVNMYKKVGPASVDRIFKGVKFDMVDELRDELITNVNISQNAYNVTLIQRLCPEALRYDMQIKRIAMQSAVDTMNHRLNRCNLTVEGEYRKLVPDFGRFFHHQLLAADEFYAPGMHFEPDDTGFDAVIIRHPLVDFGAFIKGRAVSRKELVRRIKSWGLSQYYLDAALEHLDSITTGMVMIASLVRGTCNKLSGADFDGDGGEIVTQKEVKEVYKDKDSYGNDFGASISGTLEVPFNYLLGPISFLYSWGINAPEINPAAYVDYNADPEIAIAEREPNPSIGSVAGDNVTVSSMLTAVQSPTGDPNHMEPEEVFHILLDPPKKDIAAGKAVPAQPGDKPYHRLFTVNGSDDIGVDVSFVGHEKTYVQEFIEAVRSCDWSLRSCILMLHDFNAVLSKSINDIIDAAKNAGIVIVPFQKVIESRIRSSAVAEEDYARITISRSTLAITGFTEVCGSPESKKTMRKMRLMVMDPIGLMKQRIFVLAKSKLLDALSIELNQDLKPMSWNEGLDKTIKLFSGYFLDLMKCESNNKAIAKRRVVDMACRFLDQAGITDPEQRLGVILNACNYAPEGQAPIYNSFYTQFSELIWHYVMKLCPNAVFRTRVFKFGGGEAYVGQKVTFKMGVSEDGFYASEAINGSFCLELDENNHPIVTKKVVDMIPKQNSDGNYVVLRLWKQFKDDPENANKKICLNPDFTVEQTIASIERSRTLKDMLCSIRVVDLNKKDKNDQYEIINKDINMIHLEKNKTAFVLRCNKSGENHGLLGYVEALAGIHLNTIVNKKYTIENVMQMGRDLQTVCVILKEVG